MTCWWLATALSLQHDHDAICERCDRRGSAQTTTALIRRMCRLINTMRGGARRASMDIPGPSPFVPCRAPLAAYDLFTIYKKYAVPECMASGLLTAGGGAHAVTSYYPQPLNGLHGTPIELTVLIDSDN